MCDYCTCRENDNTRLHGMRVKPIKGDYFDHQNDETYTWTGARVTNNASAGGLETVPDTGYGSTVGSEVVATPVKVGTD